MIIRKEIDLNAPLTAEQEKMLEEFATAPAVPDEDCPELTAEQLENMRGKKSRVHNNVNAQL